jgi:hypothetical protein
VVACEAFLDLRTAWMTQVVERVVVWGTDDAGAKGGFGIWDEIATALHANGPVYTGQTLQNCTGNAFTSG